MKRRRSLLSCLLLALLGAFFIAPAHAQGLLSSDRVLCRDTAGVGQAEQCTVGGAITFTGTKGITVLPADILAGLITVDGAGSGLDADLLDGKTTGTSGNTIPLLDGTNTASGVWTFTLNPSVANTLPIVGLLDTDDSSQGAIGNSAGVTTVHADIGNVAANSQLQLAVDGSTITLVTPTALRPTSAQDGLIDLGSTTARWDDVFLAEGSVIDWDNGDCILTQTGNSLDTTGCTISFASLTGAQASDADLTSWAAITRAAGFDTFTATPSMANLGSLLTDDAAGWTTFGTTPSSANLRALLTDEIDTGVLVFLGTPADDQVPVGDSASDTTWRTLADSDLATQKLQYDQATNTFSAGTDDDVPDAADYSNLTGGTGITNSPTGTINWDPTETNSNTFGSGTYTALTFNAGAVDPVLTFGSGVLTLSAIAQLNLDDELELRFFEEDAGGANYVGFKAPAALTASVTCTFENDANPIPDSCVGDGTDGGGAGSLPGDPNVDAILAWDDVAGASEWWGVGTGLDLNVAGSSVDLDFTEINSLTWGDGSFATMTFNAGATDPVFTFGSNAFNMTSANVVVGSTAAARVFTVPGGTTTPLFQINALDATTGFGQSRWSNGTTGPSSILAKSRGATVGSFTVVQADDVLGNIVWNGSDGTDFAEAARIVGYVDGTPGNDDMPGGLSFYTTSDGSGTATGRWTILSTGVLVPFADNTYDIGTSDIGVKDIYVTNNLEMGGDTSNSLNCTGGECTIEGDEIATLADANVFAANQSVGDGNSLFVGATAAATFAEQSGGAITPTLQVLGTGANDSAFGFGRYSNDNPGPRFVMAKSRSATIDGQTVVNSGDGTGIIVAGGSDGTDIEPNASIHFEVDGTPGNDDMPGRIEFNTTADGAAAVTERWIIDNAGNFKAGTGAGEIRPVAGTTAIAPLLFSAGTNLTTAADGAVEMDADVFYHTTDAGNRGYVPVRHYVRADATNTLANSGAEQALFTGANDTITLETGTYTFEALVRLNTMSATSGNAAYDPLGAGTATVGSWLWQSFCVDGAAGAAATWQGQYNTTQQTTASCATAGTNTNMGFMARGTFEVTGAGTMIPSVTLVTANAAVVAVGSYFMFERIGSTTATSVGQWN